MSSSYKIVFQGGGANLVSYIPVIEALKERQREQEFQVECYAGSSAGAIAALIAALHDDLTGVKSFFSSKTGRKIACQVGAKNSLAGILAKLAFGYTTHNEDRLRNLIRHIIDPDMKMQMIDEVNFMADVKVIVSDLDQLRPRAISLNGKTMADIINVVCSSCALPFVFRNHHTKDYKNFVDGGLIQNLPVQEVLKDGAEPLFVLAIGFDDTPNPDKADEKGGEDSFLKYAKRTASAAISSNVSSSKSLIPSQNTLVIPSHFGLLDFEEAVNALASDDARFSVIKRSSSDFFLEVTDRNAQIESHATLREQSSVPADFPSLRSACTQLAKSRLTEVSRKSGFMYAELNSLRSTKHPRFSLYDSYFSEFYYEVPEEGASCFVLGVSNYDTPEEANTLQSFQVSGEQGEIEHDILPIDDISQRAPSENLSYVAILLRRPVPRSESSHIRIIQKESIKGGFPKLLESGFDVIDFTPEHGVEYESLTLAFGIPEEKFHHYEVTPVMRPYDDDSRGLKFVEGRATHDLERFNRMSSPGTTIVAFESCSAVSEGSAFVLGITMSNQ